MTEGLRVGPVDLVPATMEHVRALAPVMQPADVEELRICGLTPLEGLLQSVRVSEVAAAALYDGEVGALFGVEPLPYVLGREDRLWFLTGGPFTRKPMAFFRAAREMVLLLRERFPVLVNHIDARHQAAQRFARAMGARLFAPVPFGPARAPFIPFRIGGA